MEKTLEKSALEKYNKFLNEVEGKEKVEEKLRFALDFMRNTLSAGESPAFRDFWEAKRFALSLFKEKLSPRVRTIYWAEYVELSDEARRVKEILDEQSSFALEQINLATQAIKSDLEHYEERLKEVPLIEVPSESKRLQKQGKEYVQLQKELDLLNAIAERLNALRKELIHTQMRIRYKNRLFDELKELGDQIFPKRKEKIQAVSVLFSSDIDEFLEGCNLEKGPFFPIKEEIKVLQKFAKTLTLSPSIFTHSREKLSSCWDQIKDKEANLREIRAEQRERCKEEIDRLVPKIDALKQACLESTITLQEADGKIQEILGEIKRLDLGQEEFKGLKRRVFDAKKPLEEKEAAEKKRQHEEEELELKRQLEAKGLLLDQLGEILNQAEALSLDALVEKWESLVKEEKTLTVAGIDKATLVSRLDSIADHIQEKKWQRMLEEESEDMASSLRTLLSERHKEKRKIKERLEGYRKLVGGSNLSLEQSMQYQELISDEKIRLDTIETMLEEIEEKLFDLEE